MNESPFTTHGDESLEARIVAWVLGEASAFEAAELERLCEERPELLVFRRRMRALHGLLTEAEAAQPDESWKLPPEKRKVLDEIFGEGKTKPSNPMIEKRVRFSARRSLLAIAACLILTVVIAGLTAPAVMRQRKRADMPASSGIGDSAGSSSWRSDRENLADNRETPARNRRMMAEDSSSSSMDIGPELGEMTSERSFKDMKGVSEFDAKPSDASVRERLAKGFADKSSGVPRARIVPPPGSPHDADAPVMTAAPAALAGVASLEESPAEYALEIAKLPSSGQGGGSGAGMAGASDDEIPSSRQPAARGGEADAFAESQPEGELAQREQLPAKGFRSSVSSLADEEKAKAMGQEVPVLGDRFAAAKNKSNLGAEPQAQPAAPAVPGQKLDEVQERLSDSAGKAEAANPQALLKAIRDQEDKVEERRKVLATIVRTKGIIYKGTDSFDGQTEVMKDETREDAIKRGLDAQDYADAKMEFERDQELLQQMKQKLLGAPAKPKAEQPRPDLTKLMEEISATEDPYSTFSLNISDASFQVAQAALARGERPDPTGIKVEQFYNAVDYGDPAPSAGEPVAVSIEQSAHPVIPGRNLVRVALKTAAAGRSASQPLRLTLLVDQSGSMVREDRRAAMDKALAGLSGLLTKNDLVTVVGFSRTPRLLADGMPGDKAGKLAELVNQAASEGGTNLEEAIKLGEQMADRRKLAGAQNRIVLFTDGAANLGNADPVRLAEKVKQLRQKGIAFDVAGIAADGLNDELLGELARNGNGRYYVVGKGAYDNFAKQLAGAFHPAAENVKVQVRFNPERVGRYKLIGFEKDRLKTEDFRNDAVDAAELAAEEAGVAVYQVEPLPGGNGELGEVSVRFRDAASAQMVERTWTIPHDANAPAFDRATPSMQLAVLSMLAAEKLKGGPLAEAIDFNQLTAPSANVKQFYGNTGRVGEMLRMVDALK